MTLKFLSGYRTVIGALLIILSAVLPLFGFGMSETETAAANDMAAQLVHLLQSVGIGIGALGIRGAVKGE